MSRYYLGKGSRAIGDAEHFSQGNSSSKDWRKTPRFI